MNKMGVAKPSEFFCPLYSHLLSLRVLLLLIHLPIVTGVLGYTLQVKSPDIFTDQRPLSPVISSLNLTTAESLEPYLVFYFE